MPDYAQQNTKWNTMSKIQG